MRLRRYILFRVLQLVPVVLVVIAAQLLPDPPRPGRCLHPPCGRGRRSRNTCRRNPGDATGSIGRSTSSSFVISPRSSPATSGLSYRSRQPVIDEMMARVPATLLLVGSSLLIAVVIGTWVGTMIARRPGSFVDTAVSTLSISLFSVPVFWLGLMLILFFWRRAPTSAVDRHVDGRRPARGPADGPRSPRPPRAAGSDAVDRLDRAIYPPRAHLGLRGSRRKLHHDRARDRLSRKARSASLRVCATRSCRSSRYSACSSASS